MTIIDNDDDNSCARTAPLSVDKFMKIPHMIFLL